MVIIGSYGSLEKRLLLAAYFTSNILEKDVVTVREIKDHFSFEMNERFVRTAIKSFSDQGLNKHTLTFDMMDEQMIWLSADGMKAAEMIAQNNETDVLEFRISAAASGVEPVTVDSTQWTGLPKEGVLDEPSALRLVSALAIADDAVARSGASNNEKAQARAYIIAMNALAEAPEPPADLIWEIVSRANQLSGIASLLVSVISLFISVSH